MSYLSLLYSGKYEEAYSILKHLTLYDFYEELNNELDKDIDQELEKTSDIKRKCNLCKARIASKAKNGEKLIELCKKICNIILNVHGILNKCNDRTDNKACSYMEYWLYYNVTRYTEEKNIVSNFYALVSMYTNFKSSNFNNCSLTNFAIDKNKFDIKRTLYEFFEIYEGIKNEISHKNNVNVRTYCKHIKENFRYFNSIKEECFNQSSCNYYDEYIQFKEKFSKPDVLNLICEKCDYEKTLCEKGSNGGDDVPCLRKKGNSFLFLVLGDDPEDILNILLNFTPFGKTLNKLKQEKKKSGHKKKEEKIEDYMKNYAAYLDSEMKNRVHLGYHATKL
ncbi:hypothetical protein PVIIG_05832 [Plasmodium vivax India VII]|uniref:VIR protein n=1 Tax=Plasmodium vivax India VII TaxID=1077284 RepID=A0A0J9UTR1_PLAVI|nr:hypothetical protein PVIIG_05832 [Plasmodium vivax India VII]